VGVGKCLPANMSRVGDEISFPRLDSILRNVVCVTVGVRIEGAMVQVC
jgi:hypothetical protein